MLGRSHVPSPHRPGREPARAPVRLRRRDSARRTGPRRAQGADQPPDHSKQRHEHLARLGRRIHEVVELVVLHPARRAGLHQSRPAEDDVHVPESLAGHDVQLLGRRDRREREPLGPQQHGHLHDAAGHDAALGADPLSDRSLADTSRARLDTVDRQRLAGLRHVARRRQSEVLGCARLSLVHRPPAGARDDAHIHDQRPRLLRQHRREQHRHGDDASGDRPDSADRAPEPAPVLGELHSRDLARLGSVDGRHRSASADHVRGLPQRRARPARHHDRRRRTRSPTARDRGRTRSRSGRSTHPGTPRPSATRSSSVSRARGPGRGPAPSHAATGRRAERRAAPGAGAPRRACPPRAAPCRVRPSAAPA